MSGIRKWLHNGSSLSLTLSFFLLPLFSPLFCQSWVLWCLSYYMSSSSKLFDQVVWPTTTLQAYCKCFHVLSALYCAHSSKKNKWLCNETVRWLIHFSTKLELRPIGRVSLNKQNPLCFYPHYLTLSEWPLSKHRREQSSPSGPSDSKVLWSQR